VYSLKSKNYAEMPFSLSVQLFYDKSKQQNMNKAPDAGFSTTVQYLFMQ
jgi:hypothetical protein